jgi:hypothetical protein
MALTGLQQFLHYPLGQDDPESKANDMISEFPGGFCGTTYHSLSKKVLTPNEQAKNLYPINCKDGDYLVDLYLSIQIPVSKGMPPKISSYVPKMISSIELQWIDSRMVLQSLKSSVVDYNFRWRYRQITDLIVSDSETNVEHEKNVIVVQLPWFFSKKLQNAIPLIYLQGLDASHPLQVKINYREGSEEQKEGVKVDVIAEYAHISSDERDFMMDEITNKNPHRRKRVIYEELSLSQIKMNNHVVRMSWLSPNTKIDISNPIGKGLVHIDPKRNPEVHWEFFGNEWVRDFQRFSYSIAATPDRAISLVLSGTPFSNIKVSETDSDEELRFVIQKIVVFNQNTIELYF